MKSFIILMILVINSMAMYAQTNAPAKPEKEQTGTVKAKYACPMHPDVVSSKMGKCPRCGSQLVVQRSGSKQANQVVFTCPMHPDVMENKAGKCPKCGMELEEKKDSTQNKGMKM